MKLSDLYLGVSSYWEDTNSGMQTVDQWDGTNTQFSVPVKDAPFEYKWVSSAKDKVKMVRPSDGPAYVAIILNAKVTFEEQFGAVGSYWQMRENAGWLYFEISSDNATWFPLASRQHGVDLSHVRVIINDQEIGEDGGFFSGWGVQGFGSAGWGE